MSLLQTALEFSIEQEWDIQRNKSAQSQRIHSSLKHLSSRFRSTVPKILQDSKTPQIVFTHHKNLTRDFGIPQAE